MAIKDEYYHLPPEQQVEIFNMLTGANVSYDTLSAELDKILAIDDEAERFAGLQSLYADMTVSAARSSVIRRSLFTLLDEDFGANVPEEMQYTIIGYASNYASDDVQTILGAACRAKGYNTPLPLDLGLTSEQKRDMLNDSVRPFTISVVREEFFKVASYNRVKIEMNKIIDGLSRREDCAWTSDPNDAITSHIAQIYSSYAHAKSESAKHGFFWRVFHPSQNRALKDTVKNAEAFFNRVGFDPERHGPEAEEYMNNTISAEAQTDMGTIKMNYKNELNFIKKAEISNAVEEINVARSKLEAATNREQSPSKNVEPENSIYKTISPVYRKYGMEMPRRTSCGSPHMLTANSEEIIAKDYDKYRKTEGFSDYVHLTFLMNFRKIMTKEIENNEHPNLEQALKDTAFVSTTLMENFTVLYELDELKDLAENSAFGNYSPEMLTNEVVKILNNANKANSISPEAIKGIITKTMAEYKNPFIKSEAKVNEELPAINEAPENEEEEMNYDEDNKDLEDDGRIPIEIPEAKDNFSAEISDKIKDKTTAPLQKNVNSI